MFKRLISYLYHRFCKSEIKNLYLGGIQRDLGRELTEGERMERKAAIYFPVREGWIEQVINESIKEYSEVLFSVCESSKQRDAIHNNINVLLNLEEKFKAIGVPPAAAEEFDEYSTI